MPEKKMALDFVEGSVFLSFMYKGVWGTMTLSL
jgi:hypothetical protein